MPGDASAPGDAAQSGDAPSDASSGWRWLVVGEAASLARKGDYEIKLGQLEADIAHAQGKLWEACREHDVPEPGEAVEPLHPLDLRNEKVRRPTNGRSQEECSLDPLPITPLVPRPTSGGITTDQAYTALIDNAAVLVVQHSCAHCARSCRHLVPGCMIQRCAHRSFGTLQCFEPTPNLSAPPAGPLQAHPILQVAASGGSDEPAGTPCDAGVSRCIQTDCTSPCRCSCTPSSCKAATGTAWQRRRRPAC